MNGLKLSNGLNLDTSVGSTGEHTGLDAGAGRLGAFGKSLCKSVEKRYIHPRNTHSNEDVVHGNHVVHVLEVDVELDDLGEGRAGELKHILEGGNGLFLRCQPGSLAAFKYERLTVAVSMSPRPTCPEANTRPGRVTAGAAISQLTARRASHRRSTHSCGA